MESGEFEILIGKSSREIILHDTIHVTSTVKIKRNYTRNSTLGDMLQDPAAKLLIEPLIRQNPMSEATDKDAAKMGMAIYMNMPARGLGWISKGAITEQKLDEILVELNKYQSNM